MAVSLKEVSSNRCFKGFQKIIEHYSGTLQCSMKFGIYLPDNEKGEKLPVLFWLSGLSCSEENFIIKSGMQRLASVHRIIVVNPDTSPRGDSVATGPDDDPISGQKFGSSAGFYLDAAEQPWAQNYRMYTYIVEEFVPLIYAQFPVNMNCGIFGHSMGGHGAISIGMKNPGLFKSISAFAPICNPTVSPRLGRTYFRAYLGENNREQFVLYDSTDLAKKYMGPKREVLIDQGSADQWFTGGDLLPENLLAISNPNLIWNYRLHQHYDHGYFFIQTYMQDHFRFHMDCWANDGDVVD